MFGDLTGVINQQASVSSQLGIGAGNARLGGYEGASLPASTYAGRDKAAVPWSPDSALFWGFGIGLLAVLGLVGASGSVRVGKARIQAGVNES